MPKCNFKWTKFHKIFFSSWKGNVFMFLNNIKYMQHLTDIKLLGILHRNLPLLQSQAKCKTWNEWNKITKNAVFTGLHETLCIKTDSMTWNSLNSTSQSQLSMITSNPRNLVECKTCTSFAVDIILINFSLENLSNENCVIIV